MTYKWKDNLFGEKHVLQVIASFQVDTAESLSLHHSSWFCFQLSHSLHLTVTSLPETMCLEIVLSMNVNLLKLNIIDCVHNLINKSTALCSILEINMDLDFWQAAFVPFIFYICLSILLFFKFTRILFQKSVKLSYLCIMYVMFSTVSFPVSLYPEWSNCVNGFLMFRVLSLDGWWAEESGCQLTPKLNGC